MIPPSKETICLVLLILRKWGGASDSRFGFVEEGRQKRSRPKVAGG
jgi:hypothetical protein